MLKPITFLTLTILASCSLLPPDNPAEEAVESVIEEYTGIDLDLSADDEVK